MNTPSHPRVRRVGYVPSNSDTVDLQTRAIDVWDDWRVPLTAVAVGGANPPSFRRYKNDSTTEAGAAQCSGSNGFQVPDSASLDVSTGLTISGWLNFDTLGTGGDQAVVFKDDAYELICENNGARPEFAIWVGAARQTVKVPNGSRLTDEGRWYHLCATYDNEVMAIYIDGSLVADSAETGNIDASATDLFIACESATGTNGLEGLLDELVILDRGLTTAEVVALYNDGAGTYTSAGATGLVAGYHLDDVASGAVDFSANSNDGASVPVGSEPTQETGLIVPGSKGVWAFHFEAGKDEELFFNTQLPHSWKVGTVLKPHFHFIIPAGTAVGTVKIGLEYIIMSPGELAPATTTTTVQTLTINGEHRDTHAISAFPDDIVVNTDTGDVSAMMLGRFYREGTADTFTDALILMEYDAHFKVDSSGSQLEYDKTPY